MRISSFLLGLLVTGSALAEPDTFGLGTGRNGSLRVESAGVVINRYARLTADAAEGSSVLTVASAKGFAVGELVLVHQSTGLASVPASGDQRPLSLEGSSVGRFEYARISAVSDGALRLSAPLLYGYAANLSQVVWVPEYTELEVRAGASLSAKPWDGGSGGILAVLVTGRLRNDGRISVDGLGFRGGAFLTHDDLKGCTGLDEPVASGGSYKGEGLVAERFGTASGRGNLSHGGGGGNCHNAGGGGGGHGGTGGLGGRSAPADGEQDAGGLGGAPLAYVPYERLVLGGGGGAGEGNNGEGTGGGAGGGLMLIRAREVRGEGRFSAVGETPPPTAGGDGAGGGGGGGAISLRVEQELRCGAVDASGGAGGDTTEASFPVGPGGGGGGGVVFLQGGSLECSTSVLAGAPGQSAATGNAHGAGPVSVGEGTAPGVGQVVESPFRVPASPALTSPVDGATGVHPRPRITGSAEPGAQYVHLFLDGAPYARLTPSADGTFSYEAPAELTLGSHELHASAETLGVRSPVSAPIRFEVVPQEGDGGLPLVLQVGCGCGASPGMGLWAGWGVLLGARLVARKKQTMPAGRR
ncbi:adventurous gliding motility protein AgmC [Archangium lipolyticum]|uniref:adventurous gliding motility protein AgmC n=1 Tax=Archangium lipolyticum TaxID=2970465 RepID=UPI0027D47D5C|nr:hemagglutinin [Archangium lipolyticum]